MKQHYSYKQQDYYIKEIVEMKDPSTRKWLKAYIYVQISSGKKFCREIEEFENLIEEKSDFVKKTIGVYGVSEPCAYLGSNKKGKFLVKKIKKQGMTLSLFEEE